MSGLPTEPRSEDELNRRGSKLCSYPTSVRKRAVHSFMQFPVEARVYHPDQDFLPEGTAAAPTWFQKRIF